MKNIITLAVLFIGLNLFAQVGINNTSPKATLDISAKTSGTKPEGLIIPQLTGDQIHTATITASPVVYNTTHKGLIIYATTADSAPTGATANITAPGYYYFDGSVWQKMAGPTAGDTTNDAWINDTTNSLVKLETKADGTARAIGTDFVINDNGKVGVGTSTPSAKLEVNSGTSNISGVKLTNLPSASLLATDDNGNIISGSSSSSGVSISKQRLITAGPSVILNSKSGDFSFRYNSTATAGYVQIRFNKVGTRKITTFIVENWKPNGYAVSTSNATINYDTWIDMPASTYLGQPELNTFRIYDLSSGITYILEVNLISDSGLYESMILQEY